MAAGHDIHGTLRRLVVADASDCRALSDEAGWNQTTDDWEFIITHSDAWGIVSSTGQVIATTVAYPVPGTRWIAMVLVSGEWRGRGLASRLLSQLNVGSTSGCVDYLDATQLGAPVYQKRGFERVGIVNRYQRERMDETGLTKQPEGLQLLEETEATPDWRMSGWGSPWCPDVIGYSEASAPASCFSIDCGTGRGAVWARPGRLAWQMGPLVAQNVSIAEKLIDACLSTLDGPVVIDVPSEAEGMHPLLQARGFAITREFERMCCGPQITMNPPGLHRYATAGPDFG